MWLSSSGAVLTLFPFFLGWFSLVAASSSNSGRSENTTDGVYGKRCLTPQIRREWRALSDEEKAEWIGAVKVSLR